MCYSNYSLLIQAGNGYGGKNMRTTIRIEILHSVVEDNRAKNRQVAKTILVADDMATAQKLAQGFLAKLNEVDK